LIGELLQPCLGEDAELFAGVIDGGDIASVKFTALKLKFENLKGKTCICHLLNNMVKRILEDYFTDDYLTDIRIFISRLRKSKPFEDIWNESCQQCYTKQVVLQKDTPTRWSSTIMMMHKISLFKQAVERMYNACKGTDHLEFVPNWGVSNGETWSLFDKFVELFLPTAETIKQLEGQKYITQSLILLQLCCLEKSNNNVAEKYKNIPQIQLVQKDLQQQLNEIWDNLPIDTVIASMLDPRTKWFNKIPVNEITEALKVMKKEFMASVRLTSSDTARESRESDSYSILFEDLVETTRKLSPNQLWQQEINMYQSMPRLDGRSDPLSWWKYHQLQLPTLSMLARKYLGIPASQASCERIFSISKNDITETRTSMKPDLAEALLMLRKKREILTIAQNLEHRS